MKGGKIVSWAGIAAFSLTIILTAFFLCVFNDPFYQKEFQKYKILEQLPQYDVQEVHSEVIDFLKNDKELANPFFSGREQQHMYDVKKIVYSVRAIWILSMIFFISLVLFYFYRKKPEKILEIIDVGAKAAAALVLLLILFSVLSFSIAFEIFHKIFFDANSYLFDPSTEKIVIIYPQELFFDVFILIAVKILLFCVLISVSVFLAKKKVVQNKAQKRNL